MGFFTSISNFFKEVAEEKRKLELKESSKSKKVRGALGGLNSALTDLEKALEKESGREIKMKKIEEEDLYK